MYPTLYHAVHALLGLDLQVLKLINTFGFLVALAFLGAARCLASELERKHAAGQIPVTRQQAKPPRPPTMLDAALSSAMVFVVAFKLFGIVLGEYAVQGGTDAQRYLLSTQVPPNWIPLLPVQIPNPAFPTTAGQILSRLKRGAVLQPDGSKKVHSATGEVLGSLGNQLLYDEEVPREGARISWRSSGWTGILRGVASML